MRKLVLLVIIIFLSANAASAPGTYKYTHTLTGTATPPGSDNFAINTLVTDTVTPNPSSANFIGNSMSFNWVVGSSTVSTQCIANIGNQYISYFTPGQISNKWKINAKEFSNGFCSGTLAQGSRYSSSSKGFEVIAAPEFSKFGLAVPLLLIGIFYTRLRKSILK
ncbi:MAG: hypothetical protein O8C66_06865 [Candidatus Methanoperedens sp.]|nr:hypothetical protein [Candidatus Methanoperedens sp.]MCZ7370214.1 hypothetical protein [Candidatus Methanoperedens sp.]